MDQLEDGLRRLLNDNSAETRSSTPDHIMAEFLVKSLDAFNSAINNLDQGTGHIPAGEHRETHLADFAADQLRALEGGIAARNDFYERVSA